MQISGIFSKTKTPILIGRLCAAMLLVATPAHADILSWGHGDFSITTLMANVGDTCSLNGKQVIICKCEQQAGAQIYQQCPTSGTGGFKDEGCRFEDTASDGTFALCAGTGGQSYCGICGCKDGVVGAWQTYNSNRVRRVIKNTKEDTFTCLYTETYDYGCASGYYTTSSTGTSSMTCSRCPGLTLSTGTSRAGNSNIGNLSITGCYQPTGTTFKDSVGLYQFTSSCNYTK